MLLDSDMQMTKNIDHLLQCGTIPFMASPGFQSPLNGGLWVLEPSRCILGLGLVLTISRALLSALPPTLPTYVQYTPGHVLSGDHAYRMLIGMVYPTPIQGTFDHMMGLIKAGNYSNIGHWGG